MEITDLKQRILTLLNDGKEILVRWDCGGDERFLDIMIDNERLDNDDELAISLELLVVNNLNLPDAGEFSLKGEGKIVRESNAIIIRHSSTSSYYEILELDEETYEVIDCKTVEEHQSGQEILLTL